MPSYQLILEYDGTAFHGWQRNPGVRTVQQVVSDCVSSMVGVSTIVQGASRTDAGVHAAGQSAAFFAELAIPPDGFRKGLNTALPPDVAVVRCVPVDDGFDPRRGSSGKHYRYRLVSRRSPSPLRERFAWHRRADLDVAAMEEAAAFLLGEHDFLAFRSAQCTAPTSVRRIDTVDITKDADELAFDITGNAFLHHMVRNIVGTLVEVGRGKRSPGWVGAALASLDRREAGPTAPARGLCLMEVFYAEPAAGPADDGGGRDGPRDTG